MKANIVFWCLIALICSKTPSHAQFFTRFWIIFFAVEVQLIILSYWRADAFFAMVHLIEHMYGSSLMFASLLHNVFSWGHVFAVRSLKSLMVACLVIFLQAPLKDIHMFSFCWFSLLFEFLLSKSEPLFCVRVQMPFVRKFWWLIFLPRKALDKVKVPNSVFRGA